MHCFCGHYVKLLHLATATQCAKRVVAGGDFIFTVPKDNSTIAICNTFCKGSESTSFNTINLIRAWEY